MTHTTCFTSSPPRERTLILTPPVSEMSTDKGEEGQGVSPRPVVCRPDTHEVPYFLPHRLNPPTT